MDKYNIISLVISGLAFLVSLGAFILSLLAFKRDRSDLQVGVEYQHSHGLGSGFQVVLVNHGRRPVTVADVRLRFRSGRMLSYSDLSGQNINLPSKLPVSLQGTESCDFFFPVYDGKGLVETPVGFRRAEAQDTLGNRYLFPNRTIRAQIDLLKLRHRISREWEASTNAS